MNQVPVIQTHEPELLQVKEEDMGLIGQFHGMCDAFGLSVVLAALARYRYVCTGEFHLVGPSEEEVNDGG